MKYTHRSSSIRERWRGGSASAPTAGHRRGLSARPHDSCARRTGLPDRSRYICDHPRPTGPVSPTENGFCNRQGPEKRDPYDDWTQDKHISTVKADIEKAGCRRYGCLVVNAAIQVLCTPQTMVSSSWTMNGSPDVSARLSISPTHLR